MHCRHVYDICASLRVCVCVLVMHACCVHLFAAFAHTRTHIHTHKHENTYIYIYYAASKCAFLLRLRICDISLMLSNLNSRISERSIYLLSRFRHHS